MKLKIATVILTLVAQPVFALDVGDRFSLGTATVRNTVTKILERGENSVDFIAEHTERDAKEHCYDPAHAGGHPDKGKCIRDRIGYPSKYHIQCRPASIRMDDIVFVPQVGGGPWVAKNAKENYIIQGDRAYFLACKKKGKNS